MENRMSDNQRRFFCRLLFLFFCCLPTAIIVYRACHPRTSEDWQAQLFSSIGIHAQVHSVETLSPNETVLRDVRVFDGHGQPVLSAMEVDLTFAPGRSQIVIRDQVRLSNHGLKYLTETINRRLMRSDACSVLLNEVVMTATEGGQTRELRVSPLEITTTPTAEGSRAVVTLQMPNANAVSDQRAIVQCNVDHIAATDQLRIHVETNQVAMPCWLADQWLPELRELGADSGFAGRFFIEPRDERLHGWIDGQFTDVNLAPAYDPSALAATGGHVFGQIKLHASFPVLPRGVGEDRNDDFAILTMPDGSTQPILPDYELQEVFNVGSAIGKTVKTARSKSAFKF
jgi:hypothetical protein